MFPVMSVCLSVQASPFQSQFLRQPIIIKQLTIMQINLKVCLILFVPQMNLNKECPEFML